MAGVDPSQIKECAGTGLIVDIQGQAPILNEEGFTIALRADIDGLKMPENNPDLPYASKTEYAHMCGHDGHTATLVLAVALIMKERSTIPANCKVRLLF